MQGKPDATDQIINVEPVLPPPELVQQPHRHTAIDAVHGIKRRARLQRRPERFHHSDSILGLEMLQRPHGERPLAAQPLPDLAVEYLWRQKLELIWASHILLGVGPHR